MWTGTSDSAFTPPVRTARSQTAEKPWQLRGEVLSGQRPQNSLLETVLDFDSATKLQARHVT